jgi:hypothetical protein
VVSAVCLVIAVVTSVSSQAFSAEPAPGGVSADAGSAFRRLGRLALAPLDDRDSERAAPPPAATTPTRELPVETQAAAPGEAAPLAVERRPLQSATPQVQLQALALASRPPLAAGDRVRAPVTFYYCEEMAGGYPRGDGGGFCGRVRDGSQVRPGSAACDYAYLGQRFRIEGDPTGRTYVCNDTGSGIHGLARDIWFLDNRSGWLWQRVVGTSAVIEVLAAE